MIAETARRNMVDCQLRTNRVTDEAVLAAFESVPRERFVPAGRRAVAYVDDDIEIAPGRFLMEPMVLARLVQEAMIGTNDVAMVIGCSVGYSAAIVSRVAGTVVAIEQDPDLAARANNLLREFGADNVAVFQALHAEGYAGQAPYDAILIDGAVDHVPATLFDQLGEGGRLVAVRRAGPVGEAILFLKVGGVISERTLFDAAIPVLPGFERRPEFAF
ncbi:MAG: protein-L-isoaspartate O-methyltransferase [Rhodospirillaceae bacterium]|nr:protein-L-isoaspartate O-methyltransferase [Rhodospirillaceae bacterium]